MSKTRQYELIYITPPEVTDEVLADLHQQIVAIADRFGATVSKTENWGRKRLAYEIAGQREGVYVLEVIDGPGAMTAELDRRLRVIDTVVRHLIVRVDEDLTKAERAKTLRQTSMATRRVKRGLPPERTEGERKRHSDDPDDDDGDVMTDAGFGRGDRGDRGERGERGDR